MRKNLTTWTLRWMIAAAGGTLFQAGCLGALQNELEVLWAAEGSLNLVNSSWLVNTFGPSILKFW